MRPSSWVPPVARLSAHVSEGPDGYSLSVATTIDSTGSAALSSYATFVELGQLQPNKVEVPCELVELGPSAGPMSAGNSWHFTRTWNGTVGKAHECTDDHRAAGPVAAAPPGRYRWRVEWDFHSSLPGGESQLVTLTTQVEFDVA